MTTTIAQIEQSVPEVIRGLKRVSGVSDGQIGHALGLSRTVTNMRMNSETKWNYAELIKLCEWFGVPFDLLLMDPKDAIVRAVNEYGLAWRFDLQKLPSGWNDVGAGQKRCA